MVQINPLTILNEKENSNFLELSNCQNWRTLSTFLFFFFWRSIKAELWSESGIHPRPPLLQEKIMNVKGLTRVSQGQFSYYRTTEPVLRVWVKKRLTGCYGHMYHVFRWPVTPGPPQKKTRSHLNRTRSDDWCECQCRNCPNTSFSTPMRLL